MAPRPDVPTSRRDDEMKPITALFADVVGSTALGEQLDADEIKLLIGECVNRMASAVEEYGGTVQAYMGDGICAYFGVPVANEDDADRAALAGLRIVESINELARQATEQWKVSDLDVRVGINSGQAAVGLVGASDPRAVALGDTTNTAARIQSAADPGVILLGDQTASLVRRRFVIEDAGSVALKGKSSPTRVWRLIAPDGSLEGAASTPLFGRNQEVGVLRAALQRLEAGTGSVVFISGESGVGKTRLLEQLATIASPAAEVLHVTCYSYLADEPYGALVRMTERRLQRLPDVGGNLDALFFERISQMWVPRPLVIAVDDAHWIDGPSYRVLELLMGATEGAPVMIAIAHRVDVEGSVSEARERLRIANADRLTELSLEPLAVEAMQDLADLVAPGAALDPDARSTLVRLSEGNPLYLQELIRALIEGGSLVRERTWTMAGTSHDLIPPALESLLVARIDRLPEGPRRLVQMAAVVGRAGGVDLLTRVAGPSTPEDLEQLVSAGILEEAGAGRWSFRHGLMHEAALSTLTASRRRAFYREVGSALEALFGAESNEHSEQLAFYYYRSDDLERAKTWLERAAERSVALAGPDAAVPLWRRLHRLAETTDDVTARQRAEDGLLAAGDSALSEGADNGDLDSSERAGSMDVEGFVGGVPVGEGATGVVYRAVAPDGRPVALKILRPELARDDEYKKRFLREARAAAQVRASHLVELIDSGESDGRLYIAMGYVEGAALSEVLERGQLDRRTAARTIRHVAAAVDALHTAGLVHRDLKPANVMVDDQGRATLIDLGLAKGRAYTLLTRPGQILGTLDYMAPEVIKGQDATTASDVYSLACLAFECLTGRTVWADLPVLEVGMAHMNNEPPDASEVDPSLPADVGLAIRHGLSKDPGRRPPTAGAFANMLRVALSS